MSESITCRTCAVSMTTDFCETGTEATTCWHSCPVCGHRRMTTQRGLYEARGARLAQVDAEVRAAASHRDEERFY